MYTANIEKINAVPQNFEHLACTYDKPSDWTAADLGVQQFDEEDPCFFLPVAAAVSADGAGAFTIGARFRYPDGSLREWLEHLCGRDQVEIVNLRLFTAGGMTGLLFEGRQSDGQNTLRMHNLYVEDGGVLYAICAMANEALYDSVAPVLAAMTESFRPAQIDGPTVALEPTPDEWFASSAIGAAIPVPAGWTAADEDNAAVLIDQPNRGVVIRIDRRPADPTLLETLEAAYAVSHPNAESMRSFNDGVDFLSFRNLEVIEDGESSQRFRIYFVRPVSGADEVFVLEVTMRDGYLPQGMPAASNLLNALAGA